MNTLMIRRPGRPAAAVGAVVAVSTVVAVGAATLMALVAGTATAAEPGQCVENVNVREQPRADARIVALCEAGTAVQVGENRDGFVQLTDVGGWAAQEFVRVNGTVPEAPADRTTPPPPESSRVTPEPTGGAEPGTSPEPTTAPDESDSSGEPDQSDSEQQPASLLGLFG
ncbi:SH3 domain-containing protein [Pseudonocardia sp. TRM90224]|uniref:SH3 domain-containing protein n=1 Tax=Pseudonocardia sp. TRM90224 TaxID=2812678 RepID=UPI001E4967D3|nr:SH3 domain-containing protein [Pseudonocardia sp. TRM90224]